MVFQKNLLMSLAVFTLASCGKDAAKLRFGGDGTGVQPAASTSEGVDSGEGDFSGEATNNNSSGLTEISTPNSGAQSTPNSSGVNNSGTNVSSGTPSSNTGSNSESPTVSDPVGNGPIVGEPIENNTSNSNSGNNTDNNSTQNNSASNGTENTLNSGSTSLTGSGTEEKTNKAENGEEEPPAAPALFSIAINSGGDYFKNSIGVEYLMDNYFREGTINTTSENIFGTQEDTLFQTERYGTYTYSIPVEPGIYTLTLHMAEIFWKEKNKRRFSIYLEEKPILEEFDIFAQVGQLRALNVEKESLVIADGEANLSVRVFNDGASIAGFILQKTHELNDDNFKIIDQTAHLSIPGSHPDIVKLAALPLSLVKQEPNSQAWPSSYSVGDTCYCLPDISPDVANKKVASPVGEVTVTRACDMVGPGPGHKDRPLYNDIQCGNGPAAGTEQDNETWCPGRVDLGKAGCIQVGPKWSFNK